MTGDLINALFEFGAAVALWGNVCRLIIDQQVRGISISSVVFFTAWGFWNIWFYPSNGFHLSFLAGCFVVSANMAWLAVLIGLRVRDRAMRSDQ